MTRFALRLKEPYETAPGDFAQVASRNASTKFATDYFTLGTVGAMANQKAAMSLPWPIISQTYRVHCRVATTDKNTWTTDSITSADALTTEYDYPLSGFYLLQCETVDRAYTTGELVDTGDGTPTAVATDFWADNDIFWLEGVDVFAKTVALISLDDAAPTIAVNTDLPACRPVLVRSVKGPFQSFAIPSEPFTASYPYDARYTGYTDVIDEWIYDTEPCQLCGHDLWFVPSYDTQGTAIDGYEFIPHAASFKVMNLSWYNADLYWSDLAGSFFAGLEVICWNGLRTTPYVVVGASEPLSASTAYGIQWKPAPSLGIAGRPLGAVSEGPSQVGEIGFVAGQEAYGAGAGGWTEGWGFTTDGSGTFSGRVTVTGSSPSIGQLVTLRIDLDSYAGSADYIDAFIQLEFNPTKLPFAVPLSNGGLLPGHG